MEDNVQNRMINPEKGKAGRPLKADYVAPVPARLLGKFNIRCPKCGRNTWAEYVNNGAKTKAGESYISTECGCDQQRWAMTPPLMRPI